MPLQTVSEKEAELARRRQKTTTTKTEVDRICSAAERDNTAQCAGCLSGLTRALFGSRGEAAANSTEPGVTSASKTSAMFTRASPQQKLQRATESLRQRAERLEAKVAEERQRAMRLAKTDKQSALRALKKSKQTQSQVDSALAALDTLENQQDLLEHAALQQTITSALGKQIKGLKGTKKLLSSAEAASEGAVELRDLVDDVANVLSESNGVASAVHDDDELLEELEQMTSGGAADDDGGGGTKTATKAREQLRAEVIRAEQEALEKQHEARDALCTAPTAPSESPVGLERQHLLRSVG